MASDDFSLSGGSKRLRRASERLLSFLSGPSTPAAVGIAPAPDAERSPLRKLYDDIGLFLFAHRLDLTPLNFGCAHDYVAGGDPQITHEVDRAIQEKRLSNGWIEAHLASQDNHVVTPNMLHDATAQLAEELDQCLDLLRRSADQQEGYGATLENSVHIASPDDLLTHLRDLAMRMMEQNRLAEREIRMSHQRVGELQITLRAARQASKHDHLTGLPNRLGFERFVETWQGSEGGCGGVLAICDIDNFKTVNDRFGHATGDRVLKSVADALHALTEKGHEVARMGGEEFVILMPGLALEQAACDVDLIRLSLQERELVDIVTKDPIGTVTFSAGLTAIYKTEAMAAALRRADAALYDAKRAGRNRIHGAVDKERTLALRW